MALNAPMRTALAMLAAGSPLVAQTRTPRFTLPEQPYDYATIAAPEHLPVALRASNTAAPTVDAQATLGRVLFYDPLLSRNHTRSCGSCHQQDRAFADGRARSRGFAGHLTRRNSMSIANLRFHEGGLFWDARASSLETMVLMPIQDPVEMGLGLDELVQRLRSEPAYPELFGKAFGTPAVDRDRIAAALAQFVRAIVSLRSKYDVGLALAQEVDRDFPNFTAAENRGKRLFFGSDGDRRNSCAACHTQRIPTWCGNAFFVDPVMFDSEQCHNNGVDAGARRDDPGHAEVTHRDEDRGKFRAPSLRNVELTGPYMHDGRFATLADVLQFYSERVRSHPQLDGVLGGNGAAASAGWGGGGAPPPSAPVATIVGRQLGFPLSRRDREDLLAFLKTLTDHHLVADPRFADPFEHWFPSARARPRPRATRAGGARRIAAEDAAMRWQSGGRQRRATGLAAGRPADDRVRGHGGAATMRRWS
ncbi:MAG TPA: cytochrome c peroxidase [Planctomycetota bacterium]|nr:cytochrome c peroxidase [Planctomycetota bacterium]